MVQIFSTGYAAAEEAEGTNASSLLSTQRSTGSGVILTADGYIVTNNHVVQGARKIEVRLHSAESASQARKSTIAAKLVGTDRETDLAVIKIERARSAVPGAGRFERPQAGATGDGIRKSAGSRRLGVDGNRQLHGAAAASRKTPWSMSRPTRPSIPATAAVRWWISRGAWSGINTFIYHPIRRQRRPGIRDPEQRRAQYLRSDPQGRARASRPDRHRRANHHAGDGERACSSSQDWGVIAADVTPDGPADKAGLKVGDIIMTLNGRAHGRRAAARDRDLPAEAFRHGRT